MTDGSSECYEDEEPENYDALLERVPIWDADETKHWVPQASVGQVSNVILPLSAIIIRDRKRKDLGDIQALADSIAEVGLLHPIIIDRNRQLIAGHRRWAAYALLGHEHIAATVAWDLDDALAKMHAERDENVCRKDYLISEAVATAEALRPIEEEAAARRKAATQAKPGEQIGGAKLAPPTQDVGKSRDKVAKVVGLGRTTLDKATQVIKAAERDPETFQPLVELMDNTGKVDRPFRDTQRLEREMKLREAAAKVPNVTSMIHADCLEWLPQWSERFPAIIIDPPYNTGRMAWDDFAGDEDFLEFTEAWLALVPDKLAPESHFFSFWPAEFGANFEELGTRIFGIKPTTRIIWQNRSLPLGRGVSKTLVHTWQYIFHWGTRDLNLWPEWDDRRFDVQTCNWAGPKVHHVEKPLALVKWLVELASYPTETVLDFFAGSGTTGIACLELDRRSVLVEKDENIFTLMKGRIAQHGR